MWLAAGVAARRRCAAAALQLLQGGGSGARCAQQQTELQAAVAVASSSRCSAAAAQWRAGPANAFASAAQPQDSPATGPGEHWGSDGDDAVAAAADSSSAEQPSGGDRRKAGWPGMRQRRGPAKGDDVLRRIQAAPTLLDLEELLDSHLRSLTYVHLGAAAMRVAKLTQATQRGGGGDPRAARQLARLMRQLEGLFERAMPMLPARPIAHLAYASAKASHPLGSRLLLSAARHLSRDGGARLAAASGADLAQLSWGLARCGAWQPELQECIDQAVISRAEGLDVACVSTLLTAAQLARNTDAALLDALSRRALVLAADAPPMQLVQVAHALVKLAHPSDATLQGIALALGPQLDALDNPSLLLVLESYRLACHPAAPALAAAAAPLVAARAQGMAPEQLLHAARVYGRLQQQQAFVAAPEGGDGSGRGGSSGVAAAIDFETVWAAVNASAAAQLDSFRPQALQSMARSLGKCAAPQIQAAAAAVKELKQ